MNLGNKELSVNKVKKANSSQLDYLSFCSVEQRYPKRVGLVATEQQLTFGLFRTLRNTFMLIVAHTCIVSYQQQHALEGDHRQTFSQ